MPKVHGTRLTPAQREQVLAAFVHRHTRENSIRTYGGRCPACEQVGPFPYTCGEALPDGPHVYTRDEWHAYHSPLVSDDEWLAKYSFHFTMGGRLDGRHRFAEYDPR